MAESIEDKIKVAVSYIEKIREDRAIKNLGCEKELKEELYLAAYLLTSIDLKLFNENYYGRFYAIDLALNPLRQETPTEEQINPVNENINKLLQEIKIGNKEVFLEWQAKGKIIEEMQKEFSEAKCLTEDIRNEHKLSKKYNQIASAENSASCFDKAAKKNCWGAALSGSGSLSIGIVLIWYIWNFNILEYLNSYMESSMKDALGREAIYLAIISKIVIISLFTYFISQLVSLCFSFLHNFFVSSHRANSLRQFELFYNSARDEDKGIIIDYASSAIFGHQPSGIKKSTDRNLIFNQVLEDTRKITTKQ